jgi:hypothetical protein
LTVSSRAALQYESFDSIVHRAQKRIDRAIQTMSVCLSKKNQWICRSADRGTVEFLRDVVGVAIRVAQGAATRCQAMDAKRDVAKEISIGHIRCLQRGKPVPVNAQTTRKSPDF